MAERKREKEPKREDSRAEIRISGFGGQGVILAGFACALQFGVLAGLWGQLPERVPVHLGLGGHADQIAAKINLFIFPAIAAAVFVANTLFAAFLHQRERLAAYLLVIVSLVVDLMVWYSFLGIVGR